MYGAPMAAFELYFWNLAMGHDDSYMPAWWAENPEAKDVHSAALSALALTREAAEGTVYEEKIPDDADFVIYHQEEWRDHLVP